jgi:hypothetical protein
MIRVLSKRSRGLLALLAVAAIVASACSNSSSSPTSSGSVAPSIGSGGSTADTSSAGPTDQGSQNGGVALGRAAAGLSDLTSYKFSITLAGDPAASILSTVGEVSSTGDAPLTYGGTIIVKPDKAADIKVSGLHVIELGGNDYMDMGNTGAFLRTTVQSPSLVDALSPAQMFSSMVSNSTASGYNRVGSETKNGIAADHYQASATALAEYGSIAGISNVTWTADIWVATDGGYAVGIAIVAKAADNSVAYEIVFDISKVNDPGNKVTAPTNIVGA